MNMNRMINMGMRMLMNIGARKGIDVAARKGKPRQDMTPDERKAAGITRQNANRARRSFNMIRRFMR